MCEQPGPAAGTAKPENTPAFSPFQKPWSIRVQDPLIILDAEKDVLGVANMGYKAMEAEAVARHIVACVNFCGEISTELLEHLGSGQYKIQVSRISFDSDQGASAHVTVMEQAPTERLVPRLVPIGGEDFSEILSAGHAQFTRDLRNGKASVNGALPGGAL